MEADDGSYSFITETPDGELQFAPLPHSLGPPTEQRGHKSSPPATVITAPSLSPTELAESAPSKFPNPLVSISNLAANAELRHQPADDWNARFPDV
jgi:hypothetical protein